MANKKRDTSLSETAAKVDLKKLRAAAIRSLDEIIKLAESDAVDEKHKFDIYKWICEMHFGKPGGARSEGTGERGLVLSFEGELDKWSN